MRCSAKQSRSLCFVLVMSFASFSDSFKYFHTADMFAALALFDCVTSSFGIIYSVSSLIRPKFRLPNIQCIPITSVI